MLPQQQEARLPKAGEPEEHAGGLYAGTDQEMPRQRQGASLHTQKEGSVMVTGTESPGDASQSPLPDYYATVAEDVLAFCGSSGGRAMIGGGLGTGYPAWARTEFIRRQRESQRSKGDEAMRKFREARSPEAFRRLAAEADLPKFEVVGEGGLDADDPQSGLGIWLKLGKENV